MIFKSLFILLQYLLPQFLLTRFAGRLADCSYPALKNRLIKNFIHRYKVNMDTAVITKIEDYPTFNAFFTRALKADARPIDSDKNKLISPVDGCISQIGRIQHATLLQAKGRFYTVEELLGGKLSDKLLPFTAGHFATFYLSPKDYHRVHMPFAGVLRQTIYIPGKLFSVNPLAAANIPKLFARNERLICIFETITGPMAVILVGAMIVGKIQTVWGLVERSKIITTRKYTDAEAIHLPKGAELGRFLLGSSVIILLGKDKLEWLPNLKEHAIVQMGQAVGMVQN